MSKLEINALKLKEVKFSPFVASPSSALKEAFFQDEGLMDRQKNRFLVETIKAILTVKSNFKTSFDAFVEKLAKNISILKKRRGPEKYGV